MYKNKEDLASNTPIVRVPAPKEYFQDLDFVLSVISDGPTKSFAFRRLKYLESKWNMYILLNEYEELAEVKRVPHRDFYNVRKVDTHVHHSSCMNQKHLLRFIKAKMRKTPKDLVIFRDGKELTLEEVFQSLNLTAYDLSIDTMDMHVRNLPPYLFLQAMMMAYTHQRHCICYKSFLQIGPQGFFPPV